MSKSSSGIDKSPPEVILLRDEEENESESNTLKRPHTLTTIESDCCPLATSNLDQVDDLTTSRRSLSGAKSQSTDEETESVAKKRRKDNVPGVKEKIENVAADISSAISSFGGTLLSAVGLRPNVEASENKVEILWYVIVPSESIKQDMKMSIRIYKSPRKIEYEDIHLEKIDSSSDTSQKSYAVVRAVHKIPVSSKSIQYSFLRSDGKGIPMEAGRKFVFKDTGNPIHLKIFDDLLISSRRSGSYVQDQIVGIFYFWLDFLFRGIDGPVQDNDSSAANTLEYLDSLLNVKHESESRAFAEKFSETNRDAMHRAVVEWIFSKIAAADPPDFMALAMFSCSVLSSACFRRAHLLPLLCDAHVKLKALDQAFEVHRDSISALGASRLALPGLLIIVQALIRLRCYSWIFILHALPLEEPEVSTVLQTLPHVTATTLHANSFCHALSLARPQLSCRAALVALRQAPSIVAVLQSVPTCSWHPLDVARRLGALATASTSESESQALVDWLRTVQADVLMDLGLHDVSRPFLDLLKALTDRRVTPSKARFMVEVGRVLAVRAAAEAQLRADARSGLAEYVGIVDSIAQRRLRGTSLPSRALEDDFYSEVMDFWELVLLAREEIATVGLDFPHSSAEYTFISWLGRFLEHDYLRVFCFFVKKVNDQRTTMSKSTQSLLDSRLMQVIKDMSAMGDSKQFEIWNHLHDSISLDYSIVAGISLLFTQSCGINVTSPVDDILRSLSSWSLWTIFLNPKKTLTLTPEVMQIIGQAQAVKVKIEDEIKNRSLLVKRALVLSKNKERANLIFGAKVRNVFEAILAFDERRARYQTLYEMVSVNSTRWLPDIKFELDKDYLQLSVGDLEEMLVTDSLDEQEMLTDFQNAKDSEVFCSMWRYAIRDDAHRYDFKALCSDIWTPTFRRWLQLVDSLADRSICLGDVKCTFASFCHSVDISKELRIMEVIANRKGKQLAPKWSTATLTAIQLCFKLYRMSSAAEVITQLVDCLHLKASLSSDQGYSLLTELAARDSAGFDSKRLSELCENDAKGLKSLTEITPFQIECLKVIGESDRLITWLQENVESHEQFGKMSQIFVGCVEEPKDVERISALHSVYSALCEFISLSNTNKKDLFAALVKKILELDPSHCLSEKILQCNQWVEWFEMLRKSAGASVGAESIHKMLQFLSEGRLVFLIEDGSMKVTPSLSDLRDIRSRVSLLLPPGNEEHSENLSRFGECLDRADLAEKALRALMESGHPKYSYFCRNIGLPKIVQFCEELNIDLESWTSFISDMRNKHYFINFFPIHHLVALAGCLSKTGIRSETMLNSQPPNRKDDIVDLVEDEEFQPTATPSSPSVDFVASMFKCVSPDISYQEASSRISDFSLDLDNSNWIDKVEELLASIYKPPCFSKSIDDNSIITPSKLTLISEIPSGQTVGYILSLYHHCPKSLSPEFVQLCDSCTSRETVTLLVRRAFTRFLIYDEQKDESCNSPTFCLAGVERLEVTVQDEIADLVQTFLEQESVQSNIKRIRFVILGEGASRLSRRLLESSHACSQEKFPLPPTSILLDSPWPLSVCALFSPAGTGKSMQARIIASANDCSFQSVLLHDANSSSVVQMLQKSSKIAGSVLLHLEIAESFRGDLETLLFNILVLGCLKSKGQVWFRSSVKNIAIELPSRWTRDSTCFLLKLLPPEAVPCSPREILNNLPSSVSLECKHEYTLSKDANGRQNLHRSVWKDSCFQRACKFLFVYQSGRLDREDPMNMITKDLFVKIRKGVIGLAGHECIRCVLEAMKRTSNDTDPTWECFTSFWKFIAAETARFDSNAFLKLECSEFFPGFRSMVFKRILILSQDFVMNSALKKVNPAFDDENLTPMKTWVESNISYIITHDSYLSFFNLRIAARGQQETSDVIALTPDLYEALLGNGVEMNPNYDNRTRDVLLKDLSGMLDVKITHDPNPNYMLTVDNMKKMMAIYARLRAGLPVIIQGETGCGKTALVNFMSQFRGSRLEVLRVHGGTSADSVRRFIQDAARLFPAEVWVFFDEINCAPLMDLFKEIVCDRRLDGSNIPDSVKIIAACNPYRKLPKSAIEKQEAMGLGFRSEDRESLGGVPLRHLVYRVSRLPHSMHHHMWDFGSLSEEVEQSYIRLAVRNEGMMDDREATCFADLVHVSQCFMRRLTDECSFVSMRDFRERALPIFRFFSSFLKQAREELNELSKKVFLVSEKNKLASPQKLLNHGLRAMILTLFVSYESRLSDASLRSGYRTRIAQCLLDGYPWILEHLSVRNGPGINVRHLADLLADESKQLQDLLLFEMNLPEGIADCRMLKENVLMMAVCIELSIPLFIVGKPGTSKSLAKKLVADTMRGNRSTARLFRYFKSVTLFSYQCSPHSTSEDIQATWDKAVRFLEGKDVQKFTSVVVLDEIGLAEDSPLMPLKVLHPLLEKPKVGFVGLSNWAIDPAKMNRGVFLSRPDPCQEDLLRTTRGIAGLRAHKLQAKLQSLTDAYVLVRERLQPRKDFYGLRDLFALVKMLRHAEVDEGLPVTEQLVCEMVQRNFGGSDDARGVLAAFMRAAPSASLDAIEPRSAVELVTQSLDISSGRNRSGRYLLLQSENPSAALEMLYTRAGLDRLRVDIIAGSNFPHDRGLSVVCGHLRKVRLCMATDRTLVCRDLDSCLEALYDLLNQFFTRSLGKLWVDLGLGQERMQCPVGENFRVIVLATAAQVATFPIPLLNRLEKHCLTISDALSSQETKELTKLRSQVNSWVSTSEGGNIMPLGDRGCGHGISDDQRFYPWMPGYFHDTIPSLLNVLKPQLGDPHRADKLINALLWIATPELVLSSYDTELFRIYFEHQEHRSLASFICSHFSNIIPSSRREIHCCKSQPQQHALVTTYDSLPSSGKLKEEIMTSIRRSRSNSNSGDRVLVDVRYLEDFGTENSFERTLSEFSKRSSDASFFVLLIHGAHTAVGLIQQVLSMVDNSVSSGNPSFHAVFVIHLRRSIPKRNRFCTIFESSWHPVYLDSLLPIWSNEGSPTLKDLWEAGTLSSSLKLSEESGGSLLKDAAQAAITSAIGRLPLDDVDYSDRSNGLVEGMRRYSQIVFKALHHDQVGPILRCRLLHILSEQEVLQGVAVRPTHWIEQLWSRDLSKVSSAGTLSQAIKADVESRVSWALSLFLAAIAADGGLDMLGELVMSPPRDSQAEEQLKLWCAATEIPALLPPATATEHSQDLTGVRSHGRGGRFHCRFPLSHIIFADLELVLKAASEIENGNLDDDLVEGIISQMRNRLAEYKPLNRVISMIRTIHFVENYVHDFVRMTYFPCQNPEAEFFILRKLLIHECGTAVTHDGGKLDTNTDEVIGAEWLLRIHVTWSRRAVRERVERLRTIWQEIPSVAEDLRAEYFEVTVDLPGLECSAIQSAIRALTADRKILASRTQSGHWLRTLRFLAPVLSEMFTSSHARADSWKRQLKALMATAIVSDVFVQRIKSDGEHRIQTILDFQESLLKIACDTMEIDASQGLLDSSSISMFEKAIKFLAEDSCKPKRSGIDASKEVKVIDESSVIVRIIDEAFRHEFLVSKHIGMRADMNLLLTVRTPAIIQELSFRDRLTLAKVMVDIAYMDSTASLKVRTAAQEQLENILRLNQSLSSSACAFSLSAEIVLSRAMDDVLAARFRGSYTPDLLRWGKAYISSAEASASGTDCLSDAIFGASCLKLCLDHLADYLVSGALGGIQARARVEFLRDFDQLLALCADAVRSPDNCRHYLFSQLLRRRGPCVIRHLVSLQPRLSWLYEIESLDSIAYFDYYTLHGQEYSSAGPALVDQAALPRSARTLEDPPVGLLAIFRESLSHSLDLTSDAASSSVGTASAQHSGTNPQRSFTLIDRAKAFIPKDSGCNDIVIGLVKGLRDNTLGGGATGPHRAILSSSQLQSDAGIILRDLLPHAVTAVIYGGGLTKPLRELLSSPFVWTTRFVPGFPTTLVEGAAERMSDIAGPHTSQARKRSHEEREKASGEPIHGFPRRCPFAEARRVLSTDVGLQLSGWSEKNAAAYAGIAGPTRGLTASAAAALRAIMHLLLLAGAAMNAQRADDIARLLHLPANDRENILQNISTRICEDIICFRTQMSCSPQDCAFLLHSVCHRMIDTARAEPNSHEFNLASLEGLEGWESAFSRRILGPVLDSADLTLEQRWSRIEGPLCQTIRKGISSNWQYRPPITLDLCHRRLDREITDHRQLPFLRGMLDEGRHLRSLRHLIPIARMCAELRSRFRNGLSLAQARAMTIRDYTFNLRGGASSDVLCGVAALRAAWSEMQQDLPSLLRAKEAVALARVSGASVEERSTEEARIVRMGFCDDAPLSLLLPNIENEGVCTLSIILGLSRLQNKFLNKYHAALRDEYEVFLDPDPVSLCQLRPAHVLGGGLDSDPLLPIVLSYAEYTTNGEGLNFVVKWEWDGLQRAVVQKCLAGRRKIDESSVPQVSYLGRVFDAATLDRLKDAGLDIRLEDTLWRPALSEILNRNGAAESLASLESASRFLVAASTSRFNPDTGLTEYLRTLRLLPAGSSMLGAACRRLRLGHFLEVRARLDLYVSLQQLQAGADPFAELGEIRMPEAVAQEISDWAHTLKSSVVDRLLLCLRELLLLRKSSFRPEAKLGDALLSFLPACVNSSRSDALKEAASKLPGRCSMQHGVQIWRRLALLRLDAHLQPGQAPQQGEPGLLGRGPESAERDEEDNAVPGGETPASIDVRIKDLICSVGKAVRHELECFNVSCARPARAATLKHWSFSPELPAGLAYENGALRGTPSAPAPRRVYVACGRPGDGGPPSRAEFIVEVRPRLPSPFSYEPLTCAEGAPLKPGACSPRVGRRQARAESDEEDDPLYSVDPPLPPGLWLDCRSGEVRGAAERALSDPSRHLVTRLTAGGSAQAPLVVCVQARAPGKFGYAPLVCTAGVEVGCHPAKPLDDGPRLGLSHQVKPPLPAGLVLDPETGSVSGSPAFPSPKGRKAVETCHTVEARNASGVEKTKLRVTLKLPEDLLEDLRRQVLAVPLSPGWAQGSWRFRVGGDTFDSALACGNLSAAVVQGNPCAAPGWPLYERFAAAHSAAAVKRVALGFHGTPQMNLPSILRDGLDPKRRKGQALGTGEYFATLAGTSMGYTQGTTKTLLVFALLMDPSGLTTEQNGVLVVHKADHQLPLGTVTFA